MKSPETTVAGILAAIGGLVAAVADFFPAPWNEVARAIGLALAGLGGGAVGVLARSQAQHSRDRHSGQT